MMNMDNINIGDVFAASWGYEQTNVDFYQVARKTKAMVELVEIGRRIEADAGPMSGTAYADPSVVKGSIGLRKPSFYRDSVHVKIDNVSGASLMKDPAAGKYCSWYA